jgi:putative ABC transport system substrate-binding protein
MRRREFLTVIDGAATWPIASRAQQAGRMRRTGWLNTDTVTATARLNAFKRGMNSTDWCALSNVEAHAGLDGLAADEALQVHGDALFVEVSIGFSALRDDLV